MPNNEPQTAATCAGKGLPDAHTLHRTGRLHEALQAYRLVLASLPSIPEDPSPSSESERQRVAEIYMKLVFLQTDLGYYEAALEDLKRAVAISPMQNDEKQHFERIQFLASRSTDPAAGAEVAEMDATIEAMQSELRKNPLYIPSEFWDFYANYHLGLLRRYGIENLKRTVAHNYQNWLICSVQDPQLLTMLNKWPEHASVQPLLNEIETPSHVGFHLSLDFTQPEYPLAQREKREVYKFAVGLIWEYVLSHDRSGHLAQLEESEVGNPVRIRRRGRLISSDLAHSVRERNILMDICTLTAGQGLCIAELGAGHGRLAEVFGRTTDYRYFIFDIPPALYVSQWYIRKLFPDQKIFTFRPFSSFAEIAVELAEARFAFFTANQIACFPNESFDLFINMNSLMEMRREQITNFLAQISRLTKVAFLSRQWIAWRNEIDGIAVDRDDFGLGGGWDLAVDQVDEIHPAFFNQVWRKRRQSR
jgi:putative sugar O-methyltransferase